MSSKSSNSIKSGFAILFLFAFGGGCLTAPNAPIGLQATVISATQVNLSWTDNADNEDGFKMERKDSDGSYSLINTFPANVTSSVDSSLTSGNTYSYRIKAYNSVGDSEYSNEVTVTVIPAADDSNAPVTVPGITKTAGISAGGSHSCARLTDDTISCWGDNRYGQLGDGTNTSSNTPVTVLGIYTAAEISAGDGHTCARLTDDTISCWGGNSYGQLGNGTNVNSNYPVPVSGITTAVEISGKNEHICTRLNDNTVKCWGRNLFGQLGDGTETNSNTPVTVAGITGAVEITAGSSHNCARLTDNTIQCWGSKGFGQLGDGTNTHSHAPVTVAGITTAVEISAGEQHTCARLTDGTIKCWGHGYGNSPVTVSWITSAAEVSAGCLYTCARLIDNTVNCWGYHNGSNTFNSIEYKPNSTVSFIPVTVSGISNAVELSTGCYQTCARLTDNTVKCWEDDILLKSGDSTN